MSILELTKKLCEELMGEPVEEFVEELTKDPKALLDAIKAHGKGANQDFVAGLMGLLAIEVVERHIKAQESIADSLKVIASDYVVSMEAEPGSQDFGGSSFDIIDNKGSKQ